MGHCRNVNYGAVNIVCHAYILHVLCVPEYLWCTCNFEKGGGCLRTVGVTESPQLATIAHRVILSVIATTRFDYDEHVCS